VRGVGCLERGDRDGGDFSRVGDEEGRRAVGETKRGGAGREGGEEREGDEPQSTIES